MGHLLSTILNKSSQEPSQEPPQQPPQEPLQEPVQEPPQEPPQEAPQEPPQEAPQEPPQEPGEEESKSSLIKLFLRLFSRSKTERRGSPSPAQFRAPIREADLDRLPTYSPGLHCPEWGPRPKVAVPLSRPVVLKSSFASRSRVPYKVTFSKFNVVIPISPNKSKSRKVRRRDRRRASNDQDRHPRTSMTTNFPDGLVYIDYYKTGPSGVPDSLKGLQYREYDDKDDDQYARFSNSSKGVADIEYDGAGPSGASTSRRGVRHHRYDDSDYYDDDGLTGGSNSSKGDFYVEYDRAGPSGVRTSPKEVRYHEYDDDHNYPGPSGLSTSSKPVPSLDDSDDDDYLEPSGPSTSSHAARSSHYENIRRADWSRAKYSPEEPPARLPVLPEDEPYTQPEAAYQTRPKTTRRKLPRTPEPTHRIQTQMSGPQRLGPTQPFYPVDPPERPPRTRRLLPPIPRLEYRTTSASAFCKWPEIEYHVYENVYDARYHTQSESTRRMLAQEFEARLQAQNEAAARSHRRQLNFTQLTRPKAFRRLLPQIPRFFSRTQSPTTTPTEFTTAYHSRPRTRRLLPRTPESADRERTGAVERTRTGTVERSRTGPTERPLPRPVDSWRLESDEHSRRGAVDRTTSSYRSSVPPTQETRLGYGGSREGTDGRSPSRRAHVRDYYDSPGAVVFERQMDGQGRRTEGTVRVLYGSQMSSARSSKAERRYDGQKSSSRASREDQRRDGQASSSRSSREDYRDDGQASSSRGSKEDQRHDGQASSSCGSNVEEQKPEKPFWDLSQFKGPCKCTSMGNDFFKKLKRPILLSQLPDLTDDMYIRPPRRTRRPQNEQRQQEAPAPTNRDVGVEEARANAQDDDNKGAATGTQCRTDGASTSADADTQGVATNATTHKNGVSPKMADQHETVSAVSEEHGATTSATPTQAQGDENITRADVQESSLSTRPGFHGSVIITVAQVHEPGTSTKAEVHGPGATSKTPVHASEANIPQIVVSESKDRSYDSVSQPTPSAQINVSRPPSSSDVYPCEPCTSAQADERDALIKAQIYGDKISTSAQTDEEWMNINLRYDEEDAWSPNDQDNEHQDNSSADEDRTNSAGDIDSPATSADTGLGGSVSGDGIPEAEARGAVRMDMDSSSEDTASSECIFHRTHWPNYYCIGFSVFLVTAVISFGILLERPPMPTFTERVAVANRLLSEVPLVDGYNALPWNIRRFYVNALSKFNLSEDLRNSTPWSKHGYSQTDIPRLKAGGVGAQFWAINAPCKSQWKDGVQITFEQMDLVRRMNDLYKDYFMPALTAKDILEAHRKGKIASLIGVEGGHSIGNNPALLRSLYSLGARYFTLTRQCSTEWVECCENEANKGPYASEKPGLSDFGKKIIRELNRLGMLVDLSYSSVQTMKDVLNATWAPVIFSHAGAKALCNHSGNVPDDVLKLVAKNGGVVMVSFNSQLLTCKNSSTIQDVAAHINHIRNVAGVDHVGLGSSFDSTNLVPKGLHDCSMFPALVATMLGDPKWTENNIKKLIGENILRVIYEAEEVRYHWNRADIEPIEENIYTGFMKGPKNCTHHV